MVKRIGVFNGFSENDLIGVYNVQDDKIIDITFSNSSEYDTVTVPSYFFCDGKCDSCLVSDEQLAKYTDSLNISELMECLVDILTKKEKKRSSNNKLCISFNCLMHSLLEKELLERIYENEPLLKEKLGYDEICYAVTLVPTNANLLELQKTALNHAIPLKVNLVLNYNNCKLNSKDILPLDEVIPPLANYNTSIRKNDRLVKKFSSFFDCNHLVEIYYALSDTVYEDDETLSILIDISKKYDLPLKIVKLSVNEFEHNIASLPEKLDSRVHNLTATDSFILKSEDLIAWRNFIRHFYAPELESATEKEEFEKWSVKNRLFEQQREDYLNWDEYFMAVAKLSAMRSKDPNTQVGACIVSNDNRILSIGYNGTPNGYPDDSFPWQREGDALETKYMYVVHAERNAILNYQGNRKSLESARIYVDLFPCNECAKEIIQSGIKEVIYLSDKYANSESTIASKRLFDACGVTYRQLEQVHQKKLSIDLKV